MVIYPSRKSGLIVLRPCLRNTYSTMDLEYLSSRPKVVELENVHESEPMAVVPHRALLAPELTGQLVTPESEYWAYRACLRGPDTIASLLNPQRGGELDDVDCRREENGKAVVSFEDQIRVRARPSEGSQDVVVGIGKGENVRSVARKVEEELGVGRHLDPFLSPRM